MKWKYQYLFHQVFLRTQWNQASRPLAELWYWVAKINSSSTWWFKHYLCKQIPGMWLFACVPIYSSWPFFLSEICRAASEHSLGWRAATTTKIEGAVNRRPGSIWTPGALAWVRDSGEAPCSQTVCVSIEMSVFKSLEWVSINFIIINSDSKHKSQMTCRMKATTVHQEWISLFDLR